MNVLGIKSKTTIRKYLNHVKGIYAPNLKKIVNIRFPNNKNLLSHEIVHRKEIYFPELLIPNYPLISLIPGVVYVFNDSLSLVNTYKSIKKAAIDLNPNNIKLNISINGREIAISRAKNKQKLVYNEKGSYYFQQNSSINR
jgi:hypothetical protein